MENKKPPLWARIIGSIVAYAFDNSLMLIALGWAIYGDAAMCVIFMVIAFYERLTQIRDRISSSEFNLTINKTEPNTVIIKGEKA